MFGARLALFCCLTAAAGGSLALDACPGRSVRDIQAQAQQQHELSFVFYHVAWCLDSRAARSIYQQVAADYQRHAHFAEVDCWQLGCNCTRIYDTPEGVVLAPQPWPTLVVYYARRQLLLYAGQWNYLSLARYVEALLRPLQRVHSREELNLLNMRNDVVVLAVLPQLSSKHYECFLMAAVQWLEIDPARSFCYAVAIGESAQLLVKQAQTPQIYLFDGHKQTVELFPGKTDWQPNQLIAWTHVAWKRQYNKLYAYNSPAALAKLLCQGPVLVLVAQNFYSLIKHSDKVPGRALDSGDRPRTCAAKPPNKRRARFLYYLHNDKAALAAYFSATSGHMAALDAETQQILLALRKRQHLLGGRSATPPDMRIAIAKYLKMSLEAVQPRSNSSLSLLLLQADLHGELLSRHNIRPRVTSLASVFIADPKRESVYVMEQDYSFEGLLQFVRDYYGRGLQAHRRNSAPRAAIAGKLQLRDVNGLELQQLLEAGNETLVLLVYATDCAFSALLLQSLLQLAALLGAEQAHSGLAFVRLNAQTNDLPWELTMPSTPTLLVFPRGRGMESRVFPAAQRTSVPHILGFILAQLEPLEQLRLAVRSCARLRLEAQVQHCWRFAQTLLMQHIASHLKHWQLFEPDRPELLARLSQLKLYSLHILRHLQL